MSKLTAKQELFAQSIVDGKTQYDAYQTAYPISKKWKRNAVDTQASILMQNSKILERIEELKKPQEDLLEANRNKLIQKAIDLSLVDNNVTTLNKLLDKLIATKSESKVDVNVRTIEDVLDDI